MDIIAVQSANKVLKKMNTEYAGAYETFIAIEGQTIFTTTKPCSILGHTLHVYVDGFYAYEGTDYSLSKTADGKAIVTFVKAMQAGATILLSTNIVGIPRFEVTNPPYDDTQVKSDIVTINNEIVAARDGKASLQEQLSDIISSISNIITALDEDTDGSIVDTIANIKTQWQDADSSLQNLIDGKANSSDLTTVQESVTAISTEINNAKGASLTLKAELDAIKLLIPTAYDDTTITDSIDTINNSLTTINNTLVNQSNSINDLQSSVGSIPAPYDDTTLKQRVSTLESKGVEDYEVVDSVTGWPYKISITNGALSTTIAHTLSMVSLSRATTGDVHVGETLQFTASATFDDAQDATSVTTFSYSSSDDTIATIDSSTGLLTAVAIGDVTVTLTGQTYGITRQATMIVSILDVPTP